MIGNYLEWLWLLGAGLLEVIWVIALKYSNGFTEIWPSIITIVSMIASGIFLSYAVKTIPIGTAYPVWVGIGAVGASIVGILLFNESSSFLRLVYIFLIMMGVIGLSMSKF